MTKLATSDSALLWWSICLGCSPPVTPSHPDASTPIHKIALPPLHAMHPLQLVPEGDSGTIEPPDANLGSPGQAPYGPGRDSGNPGAPEFDGGRDAAPPDAGHPIDAGHDAGHDAGRPDAGHDAGSCTCIERTSNSVVYYPCTPAGTCPPYQP